MASDPYQVRLKYGRQELDIQICGGTFRGICAPPPAPALPFPEDATRASLQSPIGSLPLREIAGGRNSAAILISARDRVTRSDIFVKILADELNQSGIPDDRIEVFLATGTHMKQTEEDIRSLLGEEASERLRVVHHDPHDAQNLASFGATSRGTPITINRRVCESGVKILTGRIAHHYFAGFSGGRKSIAPGVSGFETIVANHKRVMSANGDGRDPRVAAGRLAGNPIHEDMLEIAAAAKPSFCLNTVLNADHEITHVFSGHYVGAHEAGCRVVESLFRLNPGGRAAMVVASCGGWPYDISFMQVLKSIVAAERAVADGGVLVVFGECGRGLESGFLDWFRYSSLAELNRDVLANYNLKGHNTYWIKEVQSRIRIVLASRLPAEEVRAMGFVPAPASSEAVRIAIDLAGSDPSVLVVPQGNLSVFDETSHIFPSHNSAAAGRIV